jgi:hypothetical protein
LGVEPPVVEDPVVVVVVGDVVVSVVEDPSVVVVVGDVVVSVVVVVVSVVVVVVSVVVSGAALKSTVDIIFVFIILIILKYQKN